MDVLLFVKIVLWIAAVVSTGWAALCIFGMYVYYFTPRGRLEQALHSIEGVQRVFRWTPLWVAILSWIALFCMK